MKIKEASLCLRFYTADGWTREAVAELLLEGLGIERVMPRYFDERDQAASGSFELDDGLPHDDCDYFAVYGILEPFAAEALEKHEVIRF